MNKTIAIVDLEVGNLFSIARACEHAGLKPVLTQNADDLRQAAGIILPGVGAFGTAMDTLRARHLLDPLHELVALGRPMLGICLGMQLLMTRSFEFGEHAGLGLIPGDVQLIKGPRSGSRLLKVPAVGWLPTHRRPTPTGAVDLFDGLSEDAYMYYVHSFHVVPTDPSCIAATTTYGDFDYCCAVRHANIFAVQFHPERSGREGLRIYENWARFVTSTAANAGTGA